MIKLKNKFKSIDEKELVRLKKQYKGNLFDLIADLILLSYTKLSLQKYLKKPDIPGDDFLPLAKKVFVIDLSEEVFYAYNNINEIGWKYLTFSYDTKSGFEGVAYHKNDILAIGISGTDGGYADWVEGTIIDVEKNPFVGKVITAKTDNGVIFFEKEYLFKQEDSASVCMQ